MIPPEVKFDAQGLIRTIAQDAETGAVLTSAYQDRTALALTLETGFAHYFSRSKNRPWKKGERTGHLQEVIQVLLDCDGDTILLAVRQRGSVACHTGTYSCFFRRMLPEDGKIRYERVGESSFFPPVAFAVDVNAINVEARQGISPEEATTTAKHRALHLPPQGSTPVERATLGVGPAPTEVPSGTFKAAPNEPSASVLDRVEQVIQERMGYARQRSYVRALMDKGYPQINKKILEESSALGEAMQSHSNEEVVHKAADLLFHVWIGLAARGLAAKEIYQELSRRFGAGKNEAGE